MQRPYQERQLASYGYFWILSVYVFFSAKREQVFVKSHAEVGMILTALSVVGFFMPISFLRIVWEGACAVGFILGFYRAYNGKQPYWIGNLHQKTSTTQAGEPSNGFTAPTPKEGEAEQAFVAYIPFWSLVVAATERETFTHLHSVYALWIQCISIVLAMLWFPLGVAVAIFATAWGMVTCLQGQQELFPESGRYATRIRSVEDIWIIVEAAILYILVGLKGQKTTLQQQVQELQNAYVQRKQRYFANPKRLRKAYLIGPLVLLDTSAAVEKIHILQWIVLASLVLIAVWLGNWPLLVLVIYLWIWILLQLKQNNSTLLPGIGALFKESLPSSPHSHE